MCADTADCRVYIPLLKWTELPLFEETVIVGMTWVELERIETSREATKLLSEYDPPLDRTVVKITDIFIVHF